MAAGQSSRRACRREEFGQESFGAGGSATLATGTRRPLAPGARPPSDYSSVKRGISVRRITADVGA